MTQPREPKTLFRKNYDEIVKEKISNDEYSIKVQDFAKMFANMYINKTSIGKVNIKTDIDAGRLIVLSDGNAVIDIPLNEEILSGNRNSSNMVSKMKDLIEVAEDIGVELEVESMRQQNTKDEEKNSRGFEISSKKTSPSITESMNYSLRKLDLNDEFLTEFNLDSLDIPSEYSVDLARKKTDLNLFKALIGMETKSIKINPTVKSEIINDFCDKVTKLNEKSYFEENEILKQSAQNLEFNYSKPDLLILMHPEIIEKENSLKNKYNSDGTLIEFDKLIELREKNKERKLKDGRYTNEETLNEVIEDIDDSFAEIMYQKLVNNHSKKEILDLRKRLGDEKFVNELDKILEVKGKIRDDNYKISKEFLEFAQKNKEKINEGLISDEYQELLKKMNLNSISELKEYVDKSFSSENMWNPELMENLDFSTIDKLRSLNQSEVKNLDNQLDAKLKFDELINNTRADIEIRDKEFEEMQKRLDFIKDIRDNIQKTKGTVKPYTVDELRKSDENRKNKRNKIVSKVGGFIANIKNGSKKTYDDLKQAVEEDIEQEYDEQPLNEEKEYKEVEAKEANKDREIKDNEDVESKGVSSESKDSEEKAVETKTQKKDSQDKKIDDEEKAYPKDKEKKEKSTEHLKRESKEKEDKTKEDEENTPVLEDSNNYDSEKITQDVSLKDEEEKKAIEDQEVIENINEEYKEDIDNLEPNKIIEEDVKQEKEQYEEEISELDKTNKKEQQNEIKPSLDLTKQVLNETYNNFMKDKTKEIDDERLSKMKVACEVVNELVAKGVITEEAANRYLDEREHKIDIEIGKKMEKLDEDGAKMLESAHELLDRAQKNPDIAIELEKLSKEKKSKSIEVSNLKEKISNLEKDGTVKQLEYIEFEKEKNQKNKEEEKNGKDIS